MNTGNNPDNNNEIPKKTTMRRNCDFKKVDITLSHECFPESCLDVVTTYSFCLKLQQKNLRVQKSIVWKIVLVPQYLLTRMLSIIFSCEFFHYFQQVRWWFPLKWVINMCFH